MLAVIAVFCVRLGIRENGRRQHNFAFSELLARGAVLWNWYEDPIGPNFLWTGTIRRFAPPNGFARDRLGVGDWFTHSPLCTVGAYNCTMTGRDFGETELALLSRLQHLHNREIIEIDLTSRGLESVAKLSELEDLIIQADELTEEVLSPLGQARRLRKLSLRSANCSATAVEKLQKSLPNCSISIDAL
jgi:hypothetical protein